MRRKFWISVDDGIPAAYTIGLSPYDSMKVSMDEVITAGSLFLRFSLRLSTPKMPCFIFSFLTSFTLRRISLTLSSRIVILVSKSLAILFMYSRRKPASWTHATRLDIVFMAEAMVASSLQPRGTSILFSAFGKVSVISKSFCFSSSLQSRP